MIGQRVLRREDPRFLTGEGRYVENLPADDPLHITFVRSPLAHARIAGIDASAARAMPDTQVLTAADLDLGAFKAPFLDLEPAFARPLLASGVVRFVGDIVAAVLTENRATGADAAELVDVEYEPLDTVVDIHDALADEVLLFPDAGTNVCMRLGTETPDPRLFDDCEVVVSGRLVSQRMAPAPMEPRSSIATVATDGRLTLWLSTQTPHLDRDGIAAALGLEPDRVRVIGPDVGGGFGAKGLAAEDVLVAWLARNSGRTVRWTETRSENMVAMQHGRGAVLDVTIGGTRHGDVQAYRLEILQDAGAYPGIGAVLPRYTTMMASGVYGIPKIEASATAVVTHTTHVAAFRGAGRPEATQAIERAMDLYAREIGLDAAEIRRRNLIPRDAFPYTTASGATYDVGDYEQALDRALEASGYAQLRAEQSRRRELGDHRQLGIGVSIYVEVTNGLTETEFGAVEMTPGGEAILRTGSFSHGQGHETTFAMIVADQLHVPLESVHVIKGDTDQVPRGSGTYSSKSTQIGGAAARIAATEVVARARSLVAEYLEAAPTDIRLDDGRFHVAGSPQAGMTWRELTSRAEQHGRLGELSVEHDFDAGASSYPFGAHVAVVEVDTETGCIELLRLIAVDDAGTIINPVVAAGQVHGGVATGIAQALFEEVLYDEDGNPLTANFVGYAFPSAADLPPFEVHIMETPTPLNPLGAKGIGESGTVGTTPAVQSAVLDALAPYGVRHLDMPITGERVWRALGDKR
ncbi:MAG: xanthine dehydrogenase family protein molybdopterin-binding subunit [Thermoleophilaceae bacterium]